MKLFLLIFLAIYGSAHLYAYRKLTLAYPLRRCWRIAAAMALAVATAAPLFIRLAERHGHPQLATTLAYPGYIWMAVLFLFLTMSAVWDFSAIGNHVLAIALRRPRREKNSRHRTQFHVCLLLAASCSLYGYYEANDIRTEHVRIVSKKLPAAGKPLRIVQISDVHLGMLMGEQRVQKIIDAVIAAGPDLLVCTGDLIDGNLTRDGAAVGRFQQIHPSLGAYAVLGNHEYYVGLDHSLQMIREAGFTVLKGEIVFVGPIVIAGADDLTARRLSSYRELPAHLSPSFNLLLKHQPIVSPAHPFDLQLSGHVHKGQIFPFNLVTWLRFRVKSGLTALADGSHLYVNRGTGTWGPPIRLLAPPEITVIDLVPAKQ
jgi:uncharacterized protein